MKLSEKILSYDVGITRRLDVGAPIPEWIIKEIQYLEAEREEILELLDGMSADEHCSGWWEDIEKHIQTLSQAVDQARGREL
jgi:hypothetical protein